MFWQAGRFRIDLAQPRVMGIVNVTPDSFSDGGRQADVRSAIAHCERLAAEGAELLDIGGESTRPGARPVPPEIERERVLPVLRAVIGIGLPISIDTSDPGVMAAAFDLGVDIVNDVRGLRRRGAVAAVAAYPQAGACLMHSRGEPETMLSEARYDDVVREVLDHLQARLLACEAAGIARERIVLDPGIGFAKTADHNLSLLARQRELLALGRPLLVGWSRKGTLGRITGRPVGSRVVASVAAALLAVERGAAIVRVHDVAATVDALKVRAAAVAGRLTAPASIHVDPESPGSGSDAAGSRRTTIDPGDEQR